MKKISLLYITLIISLLVGSIGLSNAAYAAEIHPAANSYSYGSTSEFSKSSQVKNGFGDDQQLVDTGQNNAMLVIVSVTILIAGFGLLTVNQYQAKKQ